MKTVANVAGSLIDGSNLQSLLERDMSECTEDVTFISAYITQTAVDWMERYISADVPVTLICRLQPCDIIAGATNISALRLAMEMGWNVACLHSLHAKIYSMDNRRIYVGSANLTSNGLRIYGKGNLEACTEVESSPENLEFISNIKRSASLIDEQTLKQMEEYVQQAQASTYPDKWPDNILRDSEGLWVRDMFWCNLLSGECLDSEEVHDLDILGLEEFSPKSSVFIDRVRESRAILWLLNILEEADDNELYFGAITKELHDELADDPAPYRKDVKSLVQNLLTYCQVCCSGIVEVSAPRHSQRVKLCLES